MGGGTQLGLGSPPTGGDIFRGTTRLNAIVEHVPHDLVVTAQAGLPLARLQTALQQSKQWLALDPDLAPEATIGGVVATNATGPRRLRYGGVRDAIIGIRVVLVMSCMVPLLKAVEVVKKRRGYDLPKLFRAIRLCHRFRTSCSLSIAIASCTVHISASNISSLCDLAVRIIGSTLVPTVIDVLGDTEHTNIYTMAVRFEMGQEAVKAQAATLLAMVAEIHEDTIRQLNNLKATLRHNSGHSYP